MKRFKTVDDYIEHHEEWHDELVTLREILNDTELDEDVKWGAPCYTCDGKNLVGLVAFKSFFTLWFHQGALLKDKKKVLINAQEGKTKALRQWRFESADEIDAKVIKAYVKESIATLRSGKEIKADRSKPVTVPPELKNALQKNKKAGAAFKELTKGRQREYADYIADAKRDATKQSRLEKILPLIAAGKGLHDKYR